MKKPPSKKRQDFGPDRIKKLDSSEEALLKEALSPPPARIEDKRLELEIVSKSVVPLLAEDEREVFLFSVQSYLENYSKIGGIIDLSLDDLKKRMEIYKNYQFRQAFLKAPFLPKDFGGSITPIENDFQEMLSYFLKNKTLISQKIKMPFQEEGLSKLLYRWQAVLKSEESRRFRLESSAMDIAEIGLREKITAMVSRVKTSSCIDNIDRNHLVKLIEQGKSFEVITKELGEDCIRREREKLYKRALKDEIMSELFYIYSQNIDALSEEEAVINHYLKIAKTRDRKATRLIKRLKD